MFISKYKNIKLVICLVGGLACTLIALVFNNSFFTFSVEDSLFERIAIAKYKLDGKNIASSNDSMIFINTGKDIVLVDDTAWGKVAVSDREMLIKLFKYINQPQMGVKYTVLDIEFYYPYSINLSADTCLEKLLQANKAMSIPILLNEKGSAIFPIYKTAYSISEYGTYGQGINKFKINYNDIGFTSTPLTMYHTINKKSLQQASLWGWQNNHFTFSYIWPFYYIGEADVKQSTYNLGELLLQFEMDSLSVKRYLQNKIIFIGNFSDDSHATPIGKMPGVIVLANLYLNLVAGEHIINYGWLFFIIVSFSILSYYALFLKLPEVDIRTNFFLAHQANGIINGAISFVGAMILISLISVYLFETYVNIFLPTILLSLIYFITQKKYKKV